MDLVRSDDTLQFLLFTLIAITLYRHPFSIEGFVYTTKVLDLWDRCHPFDLSLLSQFVHRPFGVFYNSGVILLLYVRFVFGTRVDPVAVRVNKYLSKCL